MEEGQHERGGLEGLAALCLASGPFPSFGSLPVELRLKCLASCDWQTLSRVACASRSARALVSGGTGPRRGRVVGAAADVHSRRTNPLPFIRTLGPLHPPRSPPGVLPGAHPLLAHAQRGAAGGADHRLCDGGGAGPCVRQVGARPRPAAVRPRQARPVLRVSVGAQVGAVCGGGGGGRRHRAHAAAGPAGDRPDKPQGRAVGTEGSSEALELEQGMAVGRAQGCTAAAALLADVRAGRCHTPSLAAAGLVSRRPLPRPPLQPCQPAHHAARAALPPGLVHRAGGSGGARRVWPRLRCARTACMHAMPPCWLPCIRRLAACERARSHTACVPGWPAPPAPCLTSADAACAASPAHPPSIPAAAGTVREVESAERVGLVVSVLHLPPGSTVHASFARSGMVQEEAEAGE